jgi:transposase
LGINELATHMKRFIQGECRTQSILLPEALDDYVIETNPVRVVDVFVDELDLRELGFEGIEPAATGRPAYHPAVILKLYVYGYLNRVQSSRRLEKEAQRNVEVTPSAQAPRDLYGRAVLRINYK